MKDLKNNEPYQPNERLCDSDNERQVAILANAKVTVMNGSKFGVKVKDGDKVYEGQTETTEPKVPAKPDNLLALPLNQGAFISFHLCATFLSLQFATLLVLDSLDVLELLAFGGTTTLWTL